MKDVWFILRDYRDELWHRWAATIDDRVAADYRDLVASPLGERMVRTFVDDLCTIAEEEEYKVPALMRTIEERVTTEADYRLSLGFTVLDMVIAWQALRSAIIDVLVDALVRDETPSFADTLIQLKRCDAFLDRLVCATTMVE